MGAIWSQELLPWYQGGKFKTASTKWQLKFKQKQLLKYTVDCAAERKGGSELSNVTSRVSSFKRLGWEKGSLFPLTHLMCQSLRCSEISWCPHPTKELQCKTSLHPRVLLSWTHYSVPPTNCASHSPPCKSLYVHNTPHKPVLVCPSTLPGSKRNSMSLNWEEGAPPVVH